jgi:membrane protein
MRFSAGSPRVPARFHGPPAGGTVAVVTFRRLLAETLTGWWEDKAPRFGAALAFYSILSLAPMLILITPLADRLFGPRLVKGELVGQFQRLVGSQGADVVNTLIESAAYRPKPNLGMQLLGGAVLLFAASAVFAQLQDALDTIWEVTPKPHQWVWWGFMRKRILSFAMVLAVGFLLLVSLVISTLLEVLRHYVDAHVHARLSLWTAVNMFASFLIVMLLFAMVYKILPDATIAWRDVWIGAAITSALFAAGKLAIGL